MSNWLRKQLERLHLLTREPPLPARLVILQVLRDLRAKVPELNKECATIMADRTLFDRAVRQALSADNLTVEEFFREDTQRAFTWTILFTQAKVVTLVAHQYGSQAKELSQRYGQLPSTYDDSDANQVLLQRFQGDLETKIFGIETDPSKLIKDIARWVHQAIETRNPEQVISALTRLLMPAESIQEVREFLSASPLDLFNAETERQQREADKKAKRKETVDPQLGDLFMKRLESLGLQTQEVLSKTPMTEPSFPAPISTRDRVFVSYSRLDARWLEMLKTHLKPFERSGEIKRWDDTEIKPGQIWKDEIRKGMQSAKVVVLLVSPDFLASDFIANDELPLLLKAAETDGATILSLIIKPCSFVHNEDIAKYQAINPPNKTLAKMSTADRHQVFSSLTSRILEILNEA